MANITINPVEVGSAADFRGTINTNFTNLVNGIPEGANDLSDRPKQDGSASVGVSNKWARADHVHPTDVTRASTAVASDSSNGLMTSQDKNKLDHLVVSSDVITVSSQSFNEDTTFDRFRYSASIAVNGMTQNHFPIVTYDSNESVSGNYSTIAQSYEGGVKIWAKERPAATMPLRILSIVGILK